MLKDLPQHQEAIGKFSLHLDLASSINRAYQNVEACIRAEQNVAMCEEPDGEKVKDFFQEISPVIISPDFSADDKIRAIILAIISNGGIEQKSLDSIMDTAGLTMAKMSFITIPD